MIKAPESLAGNLFKAKYFPNCHLLDAPLKAKSSHIWRALHKAIPVIRYGCCREAETGDVVWTMNSSGFLDIKSAYNTLQVMNDLQNTTKSEQSDKGRVAKMWKFIWKLPLPRKIRIFLWRLYHAALPTGNQMMKRHLTRQFPCRVCQYKVEDDMHTFISCWWSKALWSYMGYAIHVDFKCFQTMADVIFHVFANLMPEEFCQISIALWYIWYSRNRVAHNDQSISPISAVACIRKLYKDYTMHKKGMISSINCVGLSWQRPKKPYIKANCDGSWNESDKIGGLGIILRNAEGLVEAVVLKHLHNCETLYECEGRALHEALKVSRDLNFQNVIFETDCLPLVQAVNFAAPNHFVTFPWFSEVMKALSRHHGWSVVFARREANCAADFLARTARIEQVTWRKLDAIPILSNFIHFL